MQNNWGRRLCTKRSTVCQASVRPAGKCLYVVVSLLSICAVSLSLATVPTVAASGSSFVSTAGSFIIVLKSRRRRVFVTHKFVAFHAGERTEYCERKQQQAEIESSKSVGCMLVVLLRRDWGEAILRFAFNISLFSSLNRQP